MQQRQIGATTVSAIGLGGMPLSIEGRPDRQQAVRTVHASLDAGVTLFDAADAYSLGSDDFGHNEELIAEALASYAGDTSRVLVATKGGHVRTSDGGWEIDGRPAYLKQAAQASAARLGVEAIGLYQFHRPDPEVPYAESIGALAELLDAGTIVMAGISNASVEQIRLAQEVLGGRLASVQNQFSPAYRSSEVEMRLCDELGIAFLPWSPLGGISSAAGLGQTHTAFAELAASRGITAHQMALAWELALAPVVVPIPGSSRPETAKASAAAADIILGPDEVAHLSAF